MISAEHTQASPGRVCPLRYRYGTSALAQPPERAAHTLYVIGGLYGNLAALDTVEAMAQHEPNAPVLCFNGDFNWFNRDGASFVEVNRRVLEHDAILGNVEAEFGVEGSDAGCGCAYPESVDTEVVERSNRIHALLASTARRHPGVCERLARLPMVARYCVGDCRVGVVHGDAESLAGWRFDVAALDNPDAQGWLAASFDAAAVDVFASSHTCLPAMRRIPRVDGRCGWVLNNGAAGMPNFSGEPWGLCTRIGITPSPNEVLYEVRTAGVYVALLPIRFDMRRWQAWFVAQWPPGSPAWQSYFERLVHGPSFQPARVIGGRLGCSPALEDALACRTT